MVVSNLFYHATVLIIAYKGLTKIITEWLKITEDANSVKLQSKKN